MPQQGAWDKEVTWMGDVATKARALQARAPPSREFERLSARDLFLLH